MIFNKLLLRRFSSVTKQKPIPGVNKVLLVSSGKGGVGKSTVAVNIALSLSHLGNRVGLLDADIYGPSVPKMMNLENIDIKLDNEGYFIPPLNYGLECFSTGFLVGEKPVVWRGLMLSKFMREMLFQVRWSNMDVLVIDLPPGTGDVQLSICQSVKVDGALIVTTPQDISLADVRKGIKMLSLLKVPILGYVTNMAYFVCPHCDKKSEIFGRLDEKHFGKDMDAVIEQIGEIPLSIAVNTSMDQGRPIVISDEKDPVSTNYLNIAKSLLMKL